MVHFERQEITSSRHTQRTTSLTPFSALVLTALEAGLAVLGRQDPGRPEVLVLSPLVLLKDDHSRSTIADSHFLSGDPYRRCLDGLGGGMGRPLNILNLEGIPDCLPHQRIGDEGGSSYALSLGSAPSGPSLPTALR